MFLGLLHKPGLDKQFYCILLEINNIMDEMPICLKTYLCLVLQSEIKIRSEPKLSDHYFQNSVALSQTSNNETYDDFSINLKIINF